MKPLERGRFLWDDEGNAYEVIHMTRIGTSGESFSIYAKAVPEMNARQRGDELNLPPGVEQAD